ncbi:hypothetical protein HYPSUDRAFT_32554 [Hypholoma sublateritium FD-334 SS-4]|uniref:DUF7053 domain-containing protein n=1 Tax=Hypholoma sublateritium (strain FD-334 SS-4) TaxID=945553 RepID=A0A0D2PEK8_HYPSF|nr:hypothetical protein HYPSUDRAFT_32554 [Hypholoma sublateritium FD-334 SS-4]
MWPFFLTREVTITKRLATSKEEVLAVLRPDTVLRTNPILTSVVPDVADDAAGPAGEARWYTIVEKVPLVGRLDTSTSFRCQWTDVADGVDMEVFAGAGTRLTTRLRVTPVDGGEVEYSDHVTFQGLFLLMPFIVSRAERSHGILRDIVAEKSMKSSDT